MDTITNKVKKPLLWIAFIILIASGLFVLHTYLLYKGIAIERRKVINEIYELYNSDSTDSMEQALLEVCIGDVNELGSYGKAERGK